MNVDIQTQEHKDVHNTGRSMITALSSFTGGELVTETDEGEKSIAVTMGPNYFEPHQKHFTKPWKDGPRIVLVGYSVRDSGRLSKEHVATLQHFGFDWDPHRKPLEPMEGILLSALKVKLIDLYYKAPLDSGRDLPQAPSDSERDLPQAPSDSGRDLPQALSDFRT